MVKKWKILYFSFVCTQDIYAVNDIAFHPIHGTLATVGSDGSYSFWDKDARTKLKSSEPLDQPLTKCAFNHSGQIFAYAVGYDWSKVTPISTSLILMYISPQERTICIYSTELDCCLQGHEHFNPAKKNFIYLRPCFEDLKPRTT